MVSLKGCLENVMKSLIPWDAGCRFDYSSLVKKRYSKSIEAIRDDNSLTIRKYAEIKPDDANAPEWRFDLDGTIYQYGFTKKDELVKFFVLDINCWLRQQSDDKIMDIALCGLSFGCHDPYLETNDFFASLGRKIHVGQNQILIGLGSF